MSLWRQSPLHQIMIGIDNKPIWVSLLTIYLLGIVFGYILNYSYMYIGFHTVTFRLTISIKTQWREAYAQ